MITYKFIPMGTQAIIEGNNIKLINCNLLLPYPIGSAFLCDVGSLLENGIIDHHTIKKENECATTLVYNEQDQFVKQIQDHNIEDYTIISHLDPDFDAIGCTYVVTKILKNEFLSQAFKQVSNYILEVDLGRIQLDENKIITPFSLILAINHIINQKNIQIISSANPDHRLELIQRKNEEVLLRSYTLIDYIIYQLESGKKINDNNFFDDLTNFDEELNLLVHDAEKYKQDLSVSSKYIVGIPNRTTDEIEEVDFIATEYPSSILWKYWTRGDTKNSKSGKGFIFTCAFLNTYKNKGRSRAIIAIDRTTDYYLKGLGMALEQSEIITILQMENSENFNPQNRSIIIDDLLGTSPEKRRKSFHRNDPWFDERNEFTIIDSPKEGSVLSNTEILDIILASNYWIMLSKKLIEENGEFKEKLSDLFPEIYFEKVDIHHDLFSEGEYSGFMEFIKSLTDGSYYDEINLIKTIKNNLLCLNKNLNTQGQGQLEVLLLSLSKIPRNNQGLTKKIIDIEEKLFNIILDALNLYGINEESNSQEYLFDLLYRYFNPRIIRININKFCIYNSFSLSKIFYFISRKTIRLEFFKSCCSLLNGNTKNGFFDILFNTYKRLSEKENIDKNETEFRLKIFTFLKRMEIFLKQKEYSFYSQPLSAFDDYKDSIDDLLMFNELNNEEYIKVRSFILKDSNYFLKSNLTINEYDIFIEDYNELKNKIIFNEGFWKDFLNIKSEIEYEFQKFTEFNILRKYTQTFIQECHLSQIFKLKQIIDKAKIGGSKNISETFCLMMDKLIVFKTFENLLSRLQITILLNNLTNLLENNFSSKKTEDTPSSSNIFIIDNEFALLRIINTSIQHLIKAQYLPDISEFQDEMQNILHGFTTVIPKCMLLGYNSSEIKVFEEIKSLYELISFKNNVLVREYNKRIDIINKILSIIGNEDDGMIKKINTYLNELERAGFFEILFNLKKHHECEFNFFVTKIKINLENDRKQTRENLKQILDQIVNEATKDELRRKKQFVDINADDQLQKEFYQNIVKTYRNLSFAAIFAEQYSTFNSDIIIDSEVKDKFLQFSKEIRKHFVLESRKYDLKLIKKQIDRFKKKKFYKEDPFTLDTIIIKNQVNPSDATSLPESINIEIYEFLVNYFLDKYHIDEARKKIEDYSSPTITPFLKFMNSWWTPILTIFLIGLTFLAPSKNPDDIISKITSIAITALIFVPVLLILGFLVILGINYLINIKNIPSTTFSKKSTERSIIAHLSDYGSNRISKLSRNLLFIDFLIPLILGIFLVTQGDNILKQILDMDGYRLYAILPLLFILSYYSLFNTITQKNKSFPLSAVLKVTTKIYMFLFSQAWIITTLLLNFIARGSEAKILTLLNIENFDIVLYPFGALTITFISLFIGLFAESIISDRKR